MVVLAAVTLLRSQASAFRVGGLGLATASASARAAARHRGSSSSGGVLRRIHGATAQQQARCRGMAPAAAAAAAAATEAEPEAEADGGGLPVYGGLIDIYQVGEQELAEYLQSKLGQPKYRAKQIRKQLYEKGVASFEEMSELPKALRASLAEHFRLGCLEVAFEQRSKDGTVKRAYRLLKDDTLIESVLMPYEDGRRTACISSQAGCAMGCKFCATGQQGFSRQLSSAEIFEQALLFARDLTKSGERLSNVVMMGEGEPLANRKNVYPAIRRLNGDLGIGARHITVSTVGLAPRIRDLADDADSLFSQIKLAVSLHAANDAERSALMPVNRRFNVEELMDACQYYVDRTNRRITFEYALIAGQNDRPQVARELGRLLSRFKGRCHVNCIPVNPTTQFEGRPSDKAAVQRFLNILEEDFGIPATVRIRRGVDIDGGCGQLKGKLTAMKLLEEQRLQQAVEAVAASSTA